MAKSFTVSLPEIQDAFNLGRSLAKEGTTDARQVVFTATGSGVSFATYSPNGTVRKELKVTDLDVEDGWKFFAKLEDLGKILGAQVPNPITEVSGVTFTDHSTRVLVTVHEVPASDEIPEDYARDVHFSLGILAPQAKIEETVSTPFPDETEGVSSLVLESYLKAIRPYLASDSTGGTNTMMCIAEDFVFTMNASLVMLMRNSLPENMSNLCLSYSTVEALGGVVSRARKATLAAESQADAEDDDPVLDIDVDGDTEGIDDAPALGQVDVNDAPEDVQYAVIYSGERAIPRFLCFKHDDVELFIRPKTNKLPRYSQFSEPINAKDDEGNFTNRGTGIVLNRVYFSNLLRKMEVDGKDASFLFKDGQFSVVCGSFDQVIPTTAFKGELEGLTFKVSLSILKRLIVGDDREYAALSQDVYFYIVKSKSGKGRTLYAVDPYDVWMTAINLS